MIVKKDTDPMSVNDLMVVTIPVPGPESVKGKRRFTGVHARSFNIGPVSVRFSLQELHEVKTASGLLGVPREHFIRQAAMNMAKAVLDGRAGQSPHVRVLDEEYQRRQ